MTRSPARLQVASGLFFALATAIPEGAGIDVVPAYGYKLLEEGSRAGSENRYFNCLVKLS